jgi:hypothetical protein
MNSHERIPESQTSYVKVRWGKMSVFGYSFGPWEVVELKSIWDLAF